MYYQGFNVAGTINTTELDGGLVSTQERPKRIEAVLIDVDAYQGNIIEGWIGTERVLAIPDYIFNTHFEAAADTPYPATNKIVRLPVGLEIPQGSAFKIGVNCGGTACDIVGAYEYTLTT